MLQIVCISVGGRIIYADIIGNLQFKEALAIGRKCPARKTAATFPSLRTI
jgi:hypothetical protein